MTINPVPILCPKIEISSKASFFCRTQSLLKVLMHVYLHADGSVAALLGPSPGASTAVSIMLDLLKRCFKEQVETDAWQNKLKEMIPSYGQSLTNNESLCTQVRRHSNEMLQLSVRKHVDLEV